MGMFSSLFGSSGSDKADKMRQAALDAFNAVKTPELSALQVHLTNYVNAGKISPEQAEAELLNSNAFNAIKTDPSLMGAQKQALLKLQDTGTQGGLDAIDKSKLQDIRDEQEQENHSSNESIMANARARGTGNSNLTSVNQLIAEQGAANRASKAGTDVAAQAQARALQALQAAGQLGGQMDAQEFSQGAAKASAQNDIDKFNAANKTDLSKFNTTNNLTAQEANLANAQHVNDANTATHNAETTANAAANQTVFNDDLQKAAGKSGTLNNWANDATAQKKAETGADVGLTSGLISAGASAASPIAGAMSAAGPTMSSMDETAPYGYKPKMAANQTASLGYSKGGEVEEPKHEGSLEEEYDKFMQNFCMGGTVKMADGGSVSIKPSADQAKKKTTARELPITPAENNEDWRLSDPNNEPIGDFKNYADAAAFADKVKEKQPNVEDFKDGGQVPGKPVVPGNSPANDIVSAKLSPQEYVVSVEERKAIERKTGDPIEKALKRLQSPQVGAVRG